MKPADSFVEQPVRSLQTMLRVLALDDPRIPSVVPDGIYGPNTMNAVSAFQRLAGLPVTGITNQAVWDQITKAYKEAAIRVDQAQPIEILMDPGTVYRASDSGPYIFLLQGMLAYLSEKYPVIPQPGRTGIMDEATLSSVAAFQALAGLKVDGNLDRITWKHIVLQFTLCAHHHTQPKNTI